MRALFESSARKSSTGHSSFIAGIATLGAALALALPSGPAAADDAAPATHARGTWQKHEYSFAFLGFTSTYSCDGLADKLRLLLLTSGARSDAKAKPGVCSSGFGRPDKFARAELTFYTLAPTDSPTDGVDGTWQKVTLEAHKPFDLGTGDCELVEQFQTSVLPLFTTRNVENRTTCVPHQDSGSIIELNFEALTVPGHRR